MNLFKIKLCIVALFYSSSVICVEYLPASLSIKFSPNNGIAEELCKSINKEQADVFVFASKFTSRSLLTCLINIQNRGRHIRIILDQKFVSENPSKVKSLLNASMCVYMDSIHKTAHNKFVIAGNDFVFSGSYNFTDDSEYSNAENVIFIRSSEVNQIYKAEFINHLNHSVLLKSKFTVAEKCSLK